MCLSIHLAFAAAAAAKSRQSCPTLCDPIDGSPPGSLSLGFSRQEHWSGLPFPSPMHTSEKWKWSRSVVSDSQQPHGLQPTRLLRQWDFPGKSTGVGCHCLLLEPCTYPNLVNNPPFWNCRRKKNMHAKSLQSCPTLGDPVDYSLLGSSVHGIIQARILEWVAIPFKYPFIFILQVLKEYFTRIHF